MDILEKTKVTLLKSGQFEKDKTNFAKKVVFLKKMETTLSYNSCFGKVESVFVKKQCFYKRRRNLIV